MIKSRKESAEQLEFVAWLEFNYPHFFFFAIPNEGKSRRNAVETIILKKMGLRTGIPDLCVLAPCTFDLDGIKTTSPIFFIEFKRKGEKSRASQLDTQAKLLKAGFFTLVDVQCQQAKEFIKANF